MDDDVEVSDAEWTGQNVRELAEQWQRAKVILERISALASWLDVDPPNHVVRLLDAALGRDPHVNYLIERRLYACEITEAGLVPILCTVEPNDVVLPVGAPSGGGR